MKPAQSIFYWMPRILCVAAIFFISLFALDAFEPGLTVGQQLIAFAIHLIPSFILTLFLILAWKWEFIGGIIFVIIGLGLSPFIYMHNYAMNHSVWMSLSIILLITFPFVIVGILFIVSHSLNKGKADETDNY